MLEAQSLVKTYRKASGDVPSLRGVDLQVERGELLFVVGPSGSGKSTLLHVLGALDRPTSGRVLLEGEDVYGRPDRALALLRRRRFGFVFQAFHLMPTLSALDNVLCPLLPDRPSARDRERAAALLGDLGLHGRLDHRPAELSGGEQQRVALARALVGEPDVVFADEPTGELDSKMGADIMGLVRSLAADRGVTVLVVTHALQHIRPDDRVLRIIDGRWEDGP